MYDILRKFKLEDKIGDFGFCRFKDLSGRLIKCRALERLPQNSNGVIVFIFPYYIDVGNRNVSRYAVVKDYHEVIMDVLNKICLELKGKYKNFNFVPFADNSPIPEVLAGVLSGLGVRGRNNLLINETYGSWVFIGEIVTDMHLNYKENKERKCMDCKMCVRKCPGGALSEGDFNKSLCLSCITQKKEKLNSFEQKLVKSSKSVWGCDICQEVCPMNIGRKHTKIQEFLNSVHTEVFLGDYDKLKNRAFQWRAKEVIERNIKLMYNMELFDE